MDLKRNEVWFVTGSQDLYGEATLRQVAENSRQIAQAFDRAAAVPVRVVFKPVLTNPEAIAQLCREADNTPQCVGLISWMHTFSPAKMWIAGLAGLRKPFVHLHTQSNREIPWDSIDMDFMNLNQAAHGDREFGFIGTRLAPEPQGGGRLLAGRRRAGRVGRSGRARPAAWADAQGGKVARFGDNMREVAVTEGDKVEAQIRFGYSVNGYGIGDLVQQRRRPSPTPTSIGWWPSTSTLYAWARRQDRRPAPARLRNAAQIELGMRGSSPRAVSKPSPRPFEDLHGLDQLPGLAVQRLMADGYGFGAEGDWKTAALVRAMKVMAAGLPGGTSFMEDYTYHLVPGRMKVLGAHMLEVCPSIADGRPSLEIHPLGIGGKADPARLVFNVPAGPALNASIIDLGSRFRLIVNEVDVVKPEQDLPKLPVARALWAPRPDLKVAAAAWIYAGGAHHTGFSQAITAKPLEMFAEMAGIEYVLIGSGSTVSEIKKELRWNEAYYTLVK